MLRRSTRCTWRGGGAGWNRRVGGPSRCWLGVGLTQRELVEL